MPSTLVLGRDMNATGTDIGPEVTLILDAALNHHKQTGSKLVVAAGFSPDFPNQPRSYAAMMADWLTQRGATDVEVLSAAEFNTYGELAVYHTFCAENHEDFPEVMGFDWHLLRVRLEARRVGDWSSNLRFVPVMAPMPLFDMFVEPLKVLKHLLPRRWQVRVIEMYRRYISSRTSY